MKTTIMLKDGRKLEYLNADIQRTNEGRSVAVYDLTTYRIVAEFKTSQILSSDPPAVHPAIEDKNKVMPA